MNIFDIFGDNNRAQIDALSRQFGLDPAQTQAAFDQLAPVIAAGMRRQAETGQGMADLINAMARGTMGGLGAANPNQAKAFGDDILGQAFGDPDVSRAVAQQVSGATGIGVQILKQMLPVIAMTVASTLIKKMFTGGLGAPAPAPRQRQQAAPPPQPQGGGLGDILSDILTGGRGVPQGQPQRAPQGSPDIDNLRNILSDILTGGQGAPRQQPQAPPQPRPQAQPMPQGDGGIGDILREILGGAAGGRAPQPQAPQQPQYTEAPRPQGRSPLDDIFGPGASSGSAADDLLNSVERRLGRRR
ncbi:MAG: DUF937 domain-containing protein [Hyphomicrobiales bacterium]